MGIKYIFVLIFGLGFFLINKTQGIPQQGTKSLTKSWNDHITAQRKFFEHS